jgi:tRNA-dihydrouridine synthase 3
MSRQHSPELSPKPCQYGPNCRFEHDLRKYLKVGKREDLTTFDGECPVFAAQGLCDAGWKCRFVGSHSMERDTDDGGKELVLIADAEQMARAQAGGEGTPNNGTINIVELSVKKALATRKIKTEKADAYIKWLDRNQEETNKVHNTHRKEENGTSEAKASRDDNRAQYTEPPFLPSEKRRIYFGPETPVLAPLTTQGNLPFRRLCVNLGAQLTYSEMAMSLPIMSGHKPEWALMKAHVTEGTPPAFKPDTTDIVEKYGYDNSKDFKFGAQISANKPWQALKATEILATHTPMLRVIDLNCGCPIDLVYRTGAGSALLDNQSKLEKMLRGMNAVSGEVPITVKIRMGTASAKPNALKLLDRLTEGSDAQEIWGGSSGVAAITLHGRSRQQRYTKNADWSYIAECAALIKNYNSSTSNAQDTEREIDGREKAAGDKVYFLGNGDCYSHIDYYESIKSSKVDSVMLARGALIKPWLFEEIATNQYLDKSASERLTYIEKFCRFGLQAWGSDEMGVGTTRRFLLEWLSFACRYVPIGLLEYLPPNLQDRPPAWKGRNDLETLLGSDNYLDWIKIR